MKEAMSLRDSLVRLDDSDEEGGVSIQVRQVMRAVPIHVKFEWRIEKFDTLMTLCSVGEAIYSKHLSFNPAPQIVWLVIVYPKGYRRECSDTACIFLEQVGPVDEKEGGVTEVQVSSRFYFLSEDDDRVWLSPGNPTITHDSVRDVMHTDDSLVLGVEFKYLPPLRFFCNEDAGVETTMLAPTPNSASSTATATKVCGGGECALNVNAQVTPVSSTSDVEEEEKREGEGCPFTPVCQPEFVPRPSPNQSASLTYTISQEHEEDGQQAHGPPKVTKSLELKLESAGSKQVNTGVCGRNLSNVGDGVGTVNSARMDLDVDAAIQLFRQLAITPPAPQQKPSTLAIEHVQKEEGGEVEDKYRTVDRKESSSTVSKKSEKSKKKRKSKFCTIL